jgi:hypothetical protein
MVNYKRIGQFGAMAGILALLCGQSAPQGCQSSAQMTSVTTSACVVINAVSTSMLKLTSTQQASVNAGVAACAATGGGANLTLASETTAILSAAIVLQQAGILNTQALAPETRKQAVKLNKLWLAHELSL